MGLALFVFLGAAILNTITDRKASPDETMPWLVLIGLAAGAIWIATQKGFFTRNRRGTNSPTPRNDKTIKPRVPHAQAPVAAPASPSILISYRRADSGDVAGRIYDRLVAYYSRETVFKDVDSIPLGIDFRKHLSESVGVCKVLLAVIGRNWIESGRGERRLDDPRDSSGSKSKPRLSEGFQLCRCWCNGRQCRARKIFRRAYGPWRITTQSLSGRTRTFTKIWRV